MGQTKMKNLLIQDYDFWEQAGQVCFGFLIMFSQSSLADCNALFEGDLIFLPDIDWVAISLHSSNMSEEVSHYQFSFEKPSVYKL